MEDLIFYINEIMGMLSRRRRIIMYVFLVSVAAALIMNSFLAPTYQAETTLRIKQPKILANSLLADLSDNENTNKLTLTYAEILKSRTVVQDVIDKTQAHKALRPTYENMRSRINALETVDTEILKVQVQADSPIEAQNIANTLVESFINRLAYLSRSEQKGVREFIGKRLIESRKELDQAESAIQKYKSEEKVVALQDETKALVDKVSMINKMAAENTVALASNQAKLTNIQQQLGREKPGFVADSMLIQQYKAKLAELEVELVGLSQNYTDKYPQVIATRAKIEEISDRLNAEVARVVSAEAASVNPVHVGLLQAQIQSETEISALSAQKVAIDGIVGEGQKELSKLPGKEQGLAKVMRDEAVSKEVYIMLAKRYEEARINEEMQPTNVQVIDQAVMPDSPIKPRKGFNVAVAALLGLFAGVGLAFLLEHINKTISTAEDVHHYLDLPVLGSIPDNNGENALQMPGWLEMLWKSITIRMRGWCNREG